MTAADLPALARVVDATLFPGDMLATMATPALQGEADDIWLTALRGGAPVGMCFAQPEDLTEGTWNMRALAVSPDHHRQGLAAGLVAALEATLRTQGARLLVVDTASDDDQAPARAFYGASGYQGGLSIPNFWGPGSDKVMYWKALHPPA